MNPAVQQPRVSVAVFCSDGITPSVKHHLGSSRASGCHAPRDGKDNLFHRERGEGSAGHPRTHTGSTLGTHWSVAQWGVGMGQPCTPELKKHVKEWGVGRWRPLLPCPFQTTRVITCSSHSRDNCSFWLSPKCLLLWKASTMRWIMIQVMIIVIIRIFSWKCCTSSCCKRRFLEMSRVLKPTVFPRWKSRLKLTLQLAPEMDLPS